MVLWVWSSCERLTSMISYMVCVLLKLLVGVLWRRSYLHSLHLEVCVEGHDTNYDLHSFSLVLVIFLDVQFFLHWIWDWLEIVITILCSCMSCERWHGYSFISFPNWLWRTWESIGDLLWELFLQVIGICIVDVLETTWIHFFEMLWVDWLYIWYYLLYW